MPVDLERLARWTFEDRICEYTARDTILYALGVGCGGEPDDLNFVYEDKLVALPSMVAVLGDPGFWLRDPSLGVNWQKILHGDQSILFHAPLLPQGVLLVRNRIERVENRGEGRGIFVTQSRTLHERETGELVAELKATIILRGDGSGEAPPRTPSTLTPAPTRVADFVLETPTLPHLALIYRLSGDMNPQHADPDVAKAAGFDAPILHGLATMGIATRAILRACCGNDPALLRSIQVRFTAPVYPGETIVTEIWKQAGGIVFRCLAAERGTVVLDASRATI